MRFWSRGRTSDVTRMRLQYAHGNNLQRVLDHAHVRSRTRPSRFSACNIEKLGVAWGRGYNRRLMPIYIHVYRYKNVSVNSQLSGCMDYCHKVWPLLLLTWLVVLRRSKGHWCEGCTGYSSWARTQSYTATRYMYMYVYVRFAQHQHPRYITSCTPFLGSS